MDYTTIDFARLKYPIELNMHWHLSNSMGSGCYGDPPGYPSYFIQHIYNHLGNTPNGAPDQGVIHSPYNGELYAVPDEREPFLRSIWLPLPIDHPRTRLWIHHAYAHSQHCYGDPAQGDKQRHVDRCIIWPVSKWSLPVRPEPEVMYGQTKVRIDAADYRRLLTAYRTQVKVLIRHAWDIAKDPANHLAVLAIRKFYPDYEPELNLIKKPYKFFQADWWEREVERPIPEKCPGFNNASHFNSMRLYKNCRYCGAQEVQDKIFYEVERKED